MSIPIETIVEEENTYSYNGGEIDDNYDNNDHSFSSSRLVFFSRQLKTNRVYSTSFYFGLFFVLLRYFFILSSIYFWLLD